MKYSYFIKATLLGEPDVLVSGSRAESLSINACFTDPCQIRLGNHLCSFLKPLVFLLSQATGRSSVRLSLYITHNTNTKRPQRLIPKPISPKDINSLVCNLICQVSRPYYCSLPDEGLKINIPYADRNDIAGLPFLSHSFRNRQDEY